MKQQPKPSRQGMVIKGVLQHATMSTHLRDNLQKSSFDSDSQPLMFDDGSSASITNDLQGFTTNPTAIMRKVKGIAESAKAAYRGTVKWKFEDDNNIIHMFVIPNMYYIIAAPTRTLSPQHFAQQMQDQIPHTEGMGCTTTSMTIVLFWNQRKFTKTVKLDPKLNIAMTNTAPGIKQYKSYPMNQEQTPNQNASDFETHIIPEDESDKGQNDDDDELSFQPLTQFKLSIIQKQLVMQIIPIKQPEKTYSKLIMMPHLQENSLWNYHTNTR